MAIINSLLQACFSAAVMLALLFGCASPVPTQPASQVEGCAQPLLRAALADDPTLDAIGTLQVEDESTGYRPFCSGTLVSEREVLTAKHCTMASNGEPLLVHYPLYFALGADPEQPRLRIRVNSATLGLPNEGGVSELGSDVALLELMEEVPRDITPLRVLPNGLNASFIGLELDTYGFAPDVTACPPETKAFRRHGRMVLELLEGNVFDAIYGDYDAYLSQAPQDDPGVDLVRRYEHGFLLQGYEAWARSGPQLSQPCHGDSGGPFVIEREGQRFVVGLTSWSLRSRAQACDYGTVFAILPPNGG